MKILISILINGFILYAITYLLGPSADNAIPAGIKLACGDCSYTSIEALKIYIVGGIILGVINTIIRPILKIASLPFFFLFLGLAGLIINGIVLYLFTYILNDILVIPGVGYEIIGLVNFAIAVAIFTVLNTLYALLFFKK